MRKTQARRPCHDGEKTAGVQKGYLVMFTFAVQAFCVRVLNDAGKREVALGGGDEMKVVCKPLVTYGYLKDGRGHDWMNLYTQ